MITLSDISLQSLIAIPNQEFKTVRGPIAQNQTGRLIAENGEYRLYYVSGFTGELANQTEILTPSSGFLITKTAYNQNGNKRAAVQPLAFYIVDGKYSETSEQFKQNVVLSYNNTIEGQEAETTEGVERTQSLNDRGETVREQREREEREAAEAEEQRLKDQRTAIYETEIIRDESKTLTLEAINTYVNKNVISNLNKSIQCSDAEIVSYLFAINQSSYPLNFVFSIRFFISCRSAPFGTAILPVRLMTFPFDVLFSGL